MHASAVEWSHVTAVDGGGIVVGAGRGGAVANKKHYILYISGGSIQHLEQKSGVPQKTEKEIMLKIFISLNSLSPVN